MFLLIFGSATLLYYGFMRASGRGDEAEEKIFNAVSSSMPDGIRSASGKARSGVCRLSDVVRQTITSIYVHVKAHPKSTPQEREVA